jgi:hypothetical protein
MLQTVGNQDFNYRIQDSTVYVNPGIARIGNTIMPYRGSALPFSSMVSFGDQTRKYQYSALVLHNYSNLADLTAVPSVLSDSTLAMSYPVLVSDSSNPYAPVYPIGLFLFYTSDGSSVSLLQSSKIRS